MKSRPTERQKQLFVAKIEKDFNDQGCWRWRGKIAKDTGYGHFAAHSKEHQKNRCFLSHRFSYEFIANRHLPENMTIDHLCRNRWCVNPDHLEVVSLKENILRGNGVAGVNARKTHCKWGHEFSKDNTYIDPKKGSRLCRLCIGRRHREFQKRQKAEV